MTRTSTIAALTLSLSLSLSVVACSEGDNPTGTGAVSITTASGGTSGSDSDSDSTTDTGATTSTSTSGVPTTGDPTTSTSGVTATTTTTTDTDTSGTTGPICDPGGVNCICDNGQCDDGLTCVDDLCVLGMVCDGDDVTEPDDDEASAHDLGEVTDDDDDTLMAAGILSGAGDVDWFTYHGLDTFGHVAEPTIAVTSSATVRVCQFIECVEGGPVTTEITCPMGTQTALSGTLRPGCCGGATFSVSEFNCPGSSDDLYVYVRIDKPSQDECVEYSFTAHN